MLEEKGQLSQSQVGLQNPFQLQRLQLVLFILPFPPLTVRPLSVLQCITNSYRENGYNSSLQLPDATLNFAKKHPLMEDKALARPLLLTKGVNFTKLVVDRVSALDQRAYNMLFIGTGNVFSPMDSFSGDRGSVLFPDVPLFSLSCSRGRPVWVCLYLLKQ